MRTGKVGGAAVAALGAMSLPGVAGKTGRVNVTLLGRLMKLSGRDEFRMGQAINATSDVLPGTCEGCGTPAEAGLACGETAGSSITGDCPEGWPSPACTLWGLNAAGIGEMLCRRSLVSVGPARQAQL